MRLDVRLVDSTILGAGFWVQVVMVDNIPQLRRFGDPEAYFEGPSKDRIIEQARAKGSGVGTLFGGGLGCLAGPFGCLLGVVIGGVAGESAGEREAATRVPKETQILLSQNIDDALASLTLGMKAFGQPFPVPGRLGDTIRVRLEKDPSVASSGLTLPLCVQLNAFAPSGDPAVPGAVAVDAPSITGRPIGSGAPVIAVTLNANATNHVVHYLWQSGLLREAGQSQVILDGLADNVRMAAFDFTGFDPALPPTLMTGSTSEPGILFVVGNVRLGTMGTRDVLAHGQAILNVTQAGDSILLEGRVADAHVNCAQRERSGVMLTPCLSDLLPVAREMAASKSPASHRFEGADLLGKLPALGFRDVRLRLSELQVTSENNPVQVTISTRARLE
jgi:hypothetical protein